MSFWVWEPCRVWISWISFMPCGAHHSKTDPLQGFDIDLGSCYCSCAWDAYRQEEGCLNSNIFFSCFGGVYIYIFCLFSKPSPEHVCVCEARAHCATVLCSSALTMIHCGLPQGHRGGWVHTVNYTSPPLVWFIALITVGSLKKEKGEEAYKIKKKKTESATVTERGRIVCECMWGPFGLLHPDIVYCCKLPWGWRSRLTVATTERRWQRCTSERCADGPPAAAPPQIGLIRGGRTKALWWGPRQMNQSRSFN